MICIFNDKDNDNDIQLLSEYIFITCTRLAHSFYCVKLEIQHLEIMRQLCQKTLFFFYSCHWSYREYIYISSTFSFCDITLLSCHRQSCSQAHYIQICFSLFTRKYNWLIIFYTFFLFNMMEITHKYVTIFIFIYEIYTYLYVHGPIFFHVVCVKSSQVK